MDNMMVWTILIALFWFDPVDTDSMYFAISKLDGKPLTFQSSAECYDHIDQNAPKLKTFIEAYYNGKATVGEYHCVIK